MNIGLYLLPFGFGPYVCKTYIPDFQTTCMLRVQVKFAHIQLTCKLISHCCNFGNGPKGRLIRSKLLKYLNFFFRQVHLGRLYLPSVSDISSEDEGEEERTLRWVIALPPIPQPLDLTSHSRKRQREEEEDNGAFLKREEGGVGGIAGSFESFADKSLEDFHHGFKMNRNVPVKQTNVDVLENKAGEASVEEVCTVFLEVDVKQEYMESDGSSQDMVGQRQQIEREGFKQEEDEKLLRSSPAGSLESLSPRLQIDLGEENCLEFHENPLVEESSSETKESSVQTMTNQPENSKEKSKEKVATGVLSRWMNNGGCIRGSSSANENRQNAEAGETNFLTKRCLTKTVKENYDPGKIYARKWYEKEKKRRY